MLHMTFEDSKGRKWERVNATRARNAFIRGELVVMCPCNIRPFGFWHMESVIGTCFHPGYDAAKLWNTYYNTMRFCNCTNSETGRYPSFYLLQKA